jgi:hypothetical protein
MTPANLVGMAAVKGLDVIALTDHNSCKNCEAALYHGKQYGVTVLPGMELCTSEEVHVICLFDNLTDALAFDAYVGERLLPIPNREEIFGKQEIRNHEDEVIGKVEPLLINATTISFDEAFALVESFHGIAYPAHLDKSSTSLLSNLGFIPPESTFPCAELRSMANLHRLRKEHSYLEHCKILSSSDAHRLEEIAEPTLQIWAPGRSPKEILKALQQKSCQ